MRQADLALRLRPGTDGALACAVMHVLFRDGLADRDYLARYTDAPAELEAHLRSRDPAWAAAITGLEVAEIEAFAALVGSTKRTFFRLGYGFSRQRNGAVNMHAALSIPAVTRRLGARGRRRVPQQQRHFPAAQDDDRGTGRARLARAPPRPVARRRRPHRRGGGVEERSAGQGDAHPEHQPARGRAPPGEGPARLRPRRPVRLRARAVPDRHRALCRHRAAGDDVPRARRPLHRRRSPASAVRAEGDRPAAGLPLQSRGDRGARRTPRRGASRPSR